MTTNNNDVLQFLHFAPAPLYPQYLNAGDVCMVKCSELMLRTPEFQSKEYPLHLYNSKNVIVVATRARQSYPDDEGYVEVLLPFPYIDSNGKGHVSMAILYSALVKDWLVSDRIAGEMKSRSRAAVV